MTTSDTEHSVSGDIALLCKAVGCVSYAFSVGKQNSLKLEWVEGSISGETPVPIQLLLDGEGGSFEPQVISHLETLFAGNRSKIELLWTGNSSSIRLCDVATPEYDKHGRVCRIVGAVRDVSREARISPDDNVRFWMDQISDRIDFGLSCWDQNEKLVLANRRFSDLHRSFSSVVRTGISLKRLLVAVAHSREVAAIIQRGEWVRSVLRDFREERAREHMLADGRCIELVPMRFESGTILNVHDITSRRSGEKALREAKELAEFANLKKSRFLRSANHDLRQPLATLKILIYSMIGVEEEEKRRHLLHSMDVTVGIMDEILSSLLQIGQLDSGRIATRITHFQASRVLERLAIEFQPQAEAAGLRFRLMPSCITVQSDRTLLERILGNFIANAIRFTETGSILIGARRRDDHLRFEVWDTGCGIETSEVERIFDEFHQVSSPRTQRGLGLGLNIAQRIAELLDHDISVASAVGKGSMFAVSVPIGSVWQSDLEEPEISERIGGEFLGVRVLFLEDNELLRRAVSLLLERWGVQVIEARDRDEALSVFAEMAVKPDLALVDYRLPDGHLGIDVLKELRTLSDQQMPGIVATADNDPDIIVRVRSEGFPILVKPINPARLRSAMHHLLYELRADPLESHDDAE